MMFLVYSRIPQGQCASIAGTIFAENPLLSSTILANAHIVGRRVLIPILPRWAVLFRGVKTFGRVISFCQNGCAILGNLGVYPEVLTTPCGQSACGGDGDFKSSSRHGPALLSLSKNTQETGSMRPNFRMPAAT